MRTAANKPSSEAPSFEPCEIVEFVQSARQGAIRPGMVGKIVQVYGSPPCYSAVTVPEANTWAIVANHALVSPAYIPRKEPLLRARVAPRIEAFQAAGHILDGNAGRFLAGPFPHDLWPRENMGNDPKHPSFLELLPIGHGFEELFGNVFEVVMAVKSPTGQITPVRAGFLQAPVSTAAVPATPTITHLVTLFDGAPSTAHKSLSNANGDAPRKTGQSRAHLITS